MAIPHIVTHHEHLFSTNWHATTITEFEQVGPTRRRYEIQITNHDGTVVESKLFYCANIDIEDTTKELAMELPKNWIVTIKVQP